MASLIAAAPDLMRFYHEDDSGFDYVSPDLIARIRPGPHSGGSTVELKTGEIMIVEKLTPVQVYDEMMRRVLPQRTPHLVSLSVPSDDDEILWG